MIAAFLRALTALRLPPLRRVIALSLGITVLSFAGLWMLIAGALYETRFFEIGWLNWVVDLLGGLAVLALSWLLFPAVATLVMSFFLERVARTIEAVDYPRLGPPRRQSLAETIGATLRLMSLALLLNLLLLPVYLLVPGINLFLFLAVNGYLLGREYFEVVALRRLEVGDARALRSRYGMRVFLGGVVIAGLFAVPFVNLVAPVLATAFMLYVFEGLPRAETRAVRS